MTLVGDGANNMRYAHQSTVEHEGRDIRGRARKLDLQDELFLTLCKLRHDFPESDLASRFHISQPTVSTIFRTCVLYLYHTFKELNFWPSCEHVSHCMSDVLKQKYPNTRVIMDATEFPIEKPNHPDLQSATWSSYINRNTFKLLVGCTPNGALSFISDIYGGRISDKELSKRSWLMKMVEKGDAFMAYRGFELDDLLPQGVRCNIPPFCVQLEPEEVLTTRHISTV